MSGPVGHMEYPHALRPGSQVLWRHDYTTTVLAVKKVKRISVEGAPPFYRSTSQSSDADFTHVVVTFAGLPWPVIFGAGDTVAGWAETHIGADYD